MGKASRRKKEAAPTSPAAAAAEGSAASAARAPAEPERPAPWLTGALLIILAAAAIFRAAYFFQYRAGTVFFGTPFLDAWIYDDWARRIAAGAWVAAEPFYFAPGYPYALAVFYRLISPQIAAVYVFQFALGLLNIVLIHRLASRAFGKRAAAAAAAIAALYASLPFLEAKIMSPTLALSLLLVSLTLLTEAASRGRWWVWAVGGILFGATSLVRPETLLMGPFVLFWIYRWGPAPARRDGGWGAPSRAAIVAGASVLAGWALAIAPAAIHNIRAGGGSTLISSQGGITFYQSNNPRARGLYVFLSKEGFSGAPEKQAQEERELAEKALGRPLTRSEVSSYWFGKGVQFIESRPGRFLWLLGMKLLRFVGSYEYSTEYIIYVERETVWLLWIPFVPFALIAALAVPSLASRVWASRGAGGGGSGEGLNAIGWLLLLTLAANIGTVLIFYVSSRYRLPSAPPLMAFAGVTVVGVLDAFRRGRRGSAYVTVAIVAAIFLLSHFEKDESATIQEANVHYNMGNIWSGKKDHERALAEYRRAIAMDDSRYEFSFNMGNTLRDLRQYVEAAESYGEAAKKRPQFFNAHYRRGLMLIEAGDLSAARQALEKAAGLRPDDFEVHLALGRVAARLGDRESAVLHLDRALAIRPDSEAARAERTRIP